METFSHRLSKLSQLCAAVVFLAVGHTSIYATSLNSVAVGASSAAVAMCAPASASSAANVGASDNVIIQERVDEYFIKESNGQIGQVKNTETISFMAQRSSDRAIAITSYSDDIKIDKASAPGTKPIYLQDDDEHELYSGNRLCALGIELTPNKAVKVSFQRTFLKPESFTTIGISESYFVRNNRTVVHVPKALAERVKIVPLHFPESMKMKREESGNEVVYTVEGENLQKYKQEAMAPSVALSAPCLKILGYFSDVNDLYHYLSSHINLDNKTHAAVDSLAQRITQGKTDVIAKIDTIASWVRQNIRYIAVENGDYGIYPEDAEVVLHKRYGVVKDQPVLSAVCCVQRA